MWITVRKLCTNDKLEVNMEIQKLRKYVGMSQREFSNYFGIPTGTLRNWEQGISNPPDYVYCMISAAIRRDKMINVETIKFVKMLDELVELVRTGIEEFSEATEGTYGTKIHYDKKTADENGNCNIVLDACIVDAVDCYHHDIISYYGYDSNEYKVQVAFDDNDGKPYVLVNLFESDELIIVDSERWYFV